MGRKRGGDRESAAYRAARTLRAEILTLEQGDPLGSEDELVAKLGISRPTLRQAARLLEHEQLIRVKRGVGGGYSVRKPDIGSVAQAAAFYLQARKTTMRDVLVASEQLNEAVMLRAAQSRDPAARERLVHTLAQIETQRGQRPDAALLAQDLEFIERVLELAANPPLELFVRALYQFGISQTGTRVFRARADRIASWAAARARLGEAILASDPELTALLSRRRTRAMLDWIAEDRGEQPAAALESLAREPFDAGSGAAAAGRAKSSEWRSDGMPLAPRAIHPRHGIHTPTSGTPTRAPRSLRRTATTDMLRLDGLQGELVLIGRARDLLDGRARALPSCLGESAYTSARRLRGAARVARELRTEPQRDATPQAARSTGDDRLPRRARRGAARRTRRALAALPAARRRARPRR